MLQDMCVKSDLLLKIIRYVAATLFCIGLFAFTRQSIYSVELHNDEISWFYHIQFYEQLFIKRDIHAPIWTSYESYDHPQLSKYIYGAYLTVRDPGVFSVRDRFEKEFGRWQFYFSPDVSHIRNQYFAPYLYHMREANFLIIIGIYIFLGYLIFVTTKNILFSFVFPLIISSNSLFMSTMIRATSDVHLVFFMLASLVTYILFRRRPIWQMLTISSLFAGMAFSSKLTGVLIVYVLLISELFLFLIGRTKIWIFFCTIVCLTVVSAMVWFSTNPALYRSPVLGTLRYFDFRVVQSARLQKAFPDAALDAVPSRLLASYCTVFDPHCRGSYFSGALFPYVWVNIVMTISGIILLIRGAKTQKDSDVHVILGVFISVVSFITMMVLPLNSDRYYIEMQLSVWLLEWLGIFWLYKVVVTKTPSAKG